MFLELLLTAMKSEGKRALGRPRSRWKGNIRNDIKEMRPKYMDWTRVARERDSDEVYWTRW